MKKLVSKEGQRQRWLDTREFKKRVSKRRRQRALRNKQQKHIRKT